MCLRARDAIALGNGAQMVNEHFVLERTFERPALRARLLSFPPLGEATR